MLIFLSRNIGLLTNKLPSHRFFLLVRVQNFRKNRAPGWWSLVLGVRRARARVRRVK